MCNTLRLNTMLLPLALHFTHKHTLSLVVYNTVQYKKGVSVKICRIVTIFRHTHTHTPTDTYGPTLETDTHNFKTLLKKV